MGANVTGDLKGDLIVRPRGDVAFVEIDGEGVVYDPRCQKTHLLNPTAVLVWRLLDGATSIEELIMQLSEIFAADPQVVQDDVRRLVSELEREELLERVLS